MKRDMDYVRDLLLKLEAAPTAIEDSTVLLSDQSSEEAEAKLNYHLEMLDQAGLLNAMESNAIGHDQWYDLRLTWQGHEFLETIRDPEVWSRTKAGAKKAGNFAMGFVVDLATAYGKHVAKERLGIEI